MGLLNNTPFVPDYREASHQHVSQKADIPEKIQTRHLRRIHGSEAVILVNVPAERPFFSGVPRPLFDCLFFAVPVFSVESGETAFRRGFTSGEDHDQEIHRIGIHLSAPCSDRLDRSFHGRGQAAGTKL